MMKYNKMIKNIGIAIQKALLESEQFNENKYDYDSTKIINAQYKMKIGGRKAPKMSLMEFNNLCKNYLLKYKDILKEQYAYNEKQSFKEIVPQLITIEADANIGLNKAIKDLHNKCRLYFEDSITEDKPRLTTSGIPYWLVKSASDYSPFIIWFLYWDGKNWRAYLPIRGNYICPKAKVMFCEDTDDYTNEKIALIDSKIISPNMDEDEFEWFMEDLDYSIDVNSEDMCIEEFENRLVAF